MCVSPVRIRNPNYGNSTPLLRATTDCVSQWLNVPCGVCDECIAKKQSDLVQRCRVLSIDHYMFFFTLTYNNESLPVSSVPMAFPFPMLTTLTLFVCLSAFVMATFLATRSNT